MLHLVFQNDAQIVYQLHWHMYLNSFEGKMVPTIGLQIFYLYIQNRNKKKEPHRHLPIGLQQNNLFQTFY